MHNESIRHILILTLICLVTASLLSGVYFLTNPRIIEQKGQQQARALEQVFPQAGYFEPVINQEKAGYFKAYAAADKKKLLGFAFSASAPGYSSTIEAIAGMDTQGVITGIAILGQNETPGLGARIEEVLVTKTLWQKLKEMVVPSPPAQPEVPAQPWFCAQFRGKKVEDLIVVKTSGTENIQAITGATISSVAITNAVRQRSGEVLEREGIVNNR